MASRDGMESMKTEGIRSASNLTAELLKQTLCVDTGCYELCVMAKHLSEHLFAVTVDEHNAAEVDNARQ